MNAQEMQTRLNTSVKSVMDANNSFAGDIREALAFWHGCDPTDWRTVGLEAVRLTAQQTCAAMLLRANETLDLTTGKSVVQAFSRVIQDLQTVNLKISGGIDETKSPQNKGSKCLGVATAPLTLDSDTGLTRIAWIGWTPKTGKPLHTDPLSEGIPLENPDSIVGNPELAEEIRQREENQVAIQAAHDLKARLQGELQGEMDAMARELEHWKARAVAAETAIFRASPEWFDPDMYPDRRESFGTSERRQHPVTVKRSPRKSRKATA